MDEFLREAMRARGWTIPRLAEACEVATGLAQKWVSPSPRNRATPSPASCEKIANALGLDPDYVLELAGHRKRRERELSEIAELRNLDPELAAINAAWPRLEEWRRKAIRTLAGSVATLTMVQPATNFAPA